MNHKCSCQQPSIWWRGEVPICRVCEGHIDIERELVRLEKARAAHIGAAKGIDLQIKDIRSRFPEL